MMKYRKYLMIIVCLSVFNSYWSQKWIFDLKPGFKIYGQSYLKTDGMINSSALSSYKYKKLDRTKQLLIEPELYLDFFEINKKWQIGLGVSIFNFRNRIILTSVGYSSIADSTSTDLFYEHSMKNIKLNYAQFSGTITRTFRISNFFDKFILNKLIFGFGINKPSMFNPTVSIKKYYLSIMDGNSGYVTSLNYKKNDFWGKYSPFLQIKYEMVIMNRRNDYGMFNLNISYVQGFQNQYSYSMSSSTLDGANALVNTRFRASGLRIGISKTFSFKKKEKSLDTNYL